MQSTSDKEIIREIINYIKNQEKTLRVQLPLLNQQNTLGLSILLLSVLGFVTSGFLYFIGVIPGWACIILGALSTSIAHEIEHDLIHQQYFKSNGVIYHFMMVMVWLIRPNTINPWYRKKIHLNHHKVSGTSQDIEERLVGNGIKSHLLRMLVVCDGLLGLIVRTKQFSREIKDYNFFKLFNAGFPLTTIYYIVLYSFLLFHIFDFIVEYMAVVIHYPAWLMTLVDWISFTVVVWIAPSYLRSACLNFVTSSMHYYGGAFNMLQQTQVLNHWLFMPFQLFCFNFGNTHTIHHFVPSQPFYIRQIISKRVNVFLKEKGVKFNDLTSILAANRYPVSPKIAN
ncbi:MAG: fatty acid desaturase [Paraglaciecola sp.]|uniref:fatty acid desaturase n=1 Tax=Paraglaciecola sp. TaxID=1920173 RepID=UPI003296C48B